MPQLVRVGATTILLLLFGTALVETPEQLIQGDHWKRARASLQADLHGQAESARVLVLQAKIGRAFGDLAPAQKSAERAIALDPKNAEAHFELGRIYAEQAQQAGLLEKLSLAISARREFGTAVNINPNYVEAHYALMAFYLQAPEMIGGSIGSARIEAAAITKTDPAMGFLADATIAQREKQETTAEDLYRRSHDSAPRRYDIVTGYCSYLTGQKRWTEAEKCANELVKLDASRVNAYSLLATVFASQQRWKQLDAILADGEKNVPDNLAPYFQAGKVLAESAADNARGERYLRKYLTQEPEPIGPRISRAHWRLAQILEKQGRKPDAIVELETTIRLEPGFSAAQNDLQRLR